MFINVIFNKLYFSLNIHIFLWLGLRQGTHTSRSLISLFQTISVSDRHSCCKRIWIFRSGAIFANKMKGTYKVVGRKLWQIKLVFMTSACMNPCLCPRSVSLFTWETDKEHSFYITIRHCPYIWLFRIVFYRPWEQYFTISIKRQFDIYKFLQAMLSCPNFRLNQSQRDIYTTWSVCNLAVFLVIKCGFAIN